MLDCTFVPNVLVELAHEWASEDREALLAGRHSGAGEVDKIITLLELTCCSMAAIIEKNGVGSIPVALQFRRLLSEFTNLELSWWREDEIRRFQ